MSRSPVKWPSGGGRGQSMYQNLEFWENRPGRNPGPSLMRRDPVSNNFKLHVRSIPSSWNKTIFTSIFSKCGDPKNIYINPKKTPNAVTWGFVEYETYQEAHNAVRELNNNVLLNIQVSFAKEKPGEDEIDPVLQFLASDSLEGESYHHSTESLVDPRMLIKTVKNDSGFSTDITIEDFHKINPDQETLKNMEEALFQKILEIYKEDESSVAKCNMCKAKCSTACSGCTSVFYCSEKCQNTDWNLHSQTCTGAGVGAAENNRSQSRGSGDHRQARSEFTNGYGSFDSERENRSDRRANTFGDRQDFRGNNRDRQRPEQNGSDYQGKRNLFEERRAKNFSRQNENGGFQNRAQNNRRTQYNQESRNSSFKPKSDAVDADENWGSKTQDGDVKNSSNVTPGLDFINKEKSILQVVVDKSEEVKVPVPTVKEVKPTTDKQILKPGLVLEVTLAHSEGQGLIWVHQHNQLGDLGALMAELIEFFKTGRSQCTPVQDDVCGTLYDNAWYRCRITSLDPLTIHCIDFGYTEKIEASMLFELSTELKAVPPFATKIKFVDEHPQSVLEEGKMLVKLIKKIDSYWLAELKNDKVTRSDVSEAKTTKIDSTMAMSTTALSKEPAEVQQTVAANTSVVESPEPSAQLPYPSMFDTTNFTTVVVTYVAPSQEEDAPKDTYFVGAETVWDSLSDMCNHFEKVNELSEVLTPKRGTKGIAKYSGQWYRVKVVSLDPLLVYYIDFGNIEPLEPSSLKKCPETHIDVPNLVHKVKLAPGTSQKYFSLPDESQLRVKPVSRLADNTIVVEVEGENYAEMSTTSKVAEVAVSSASTTTFASTPGPISTSCPTTPTSTPGGDHISVSTPVSAISASTPVPATSASTPVSAISASTPVPAISASTPVSAISESTPVPAISASTETPSTSLQTNSTASGLTDSAIPTAEDSLGHSQGNINMIPSTPEATVDMIQEQWTVAFVPSRVELERNSLFGQVYSTNIPKAICFVKDNEIYQGYLSSQEFNPNFKPKVGETVGLKVQSDDWERGRVLEGGLVALIDISGVVRNPQMFKLPDTYINIPPMASVLTLSKEDPDLLNCLQAMDEVIFQVVKVVRNEGHTVAHVKSNQPPVEGELRSWDYDPLHTADRLASGDSVTITKVINSNTLLVTPANDLEIQQEIQIACRKMCEDFTSLPKEGDYVSFLDKDSDGYLRCRVDKVDGDDCVIYAVDNAVCHRTKLSNLRPLPASLRNIPCRISQIELKKVGKVNLTEQAQVYLSHIVDEDKFLTILEIDETGKTTLSVEGEEVTLNDKLTELLKPQVVPDSDGKLTILSLPELAVPLDQEFKMMVTQKEPLYVQLMSQLGSYYALHKQLQNHCYGDNVPYNPREGELCLALYEGDWYRCRCLRETNTGVSTLMLVDYGNIINTETSNIRRILPEMLTVPSIGIPCKIHGLPDTVTPALRARLDEILAVDTKLPGVFVAENEGCYQVVFEPVKQAIKEFQ